MRIEAYSQIQQLYNRPNTKKVAESKKTGSFKDHFELSTAGKDMQTVKSALENTPDVRMDLVNSLKQQIDNGTYDVDMDDFAAKILENNGLF